MRLKHKFGAIRTTVKGRSYSSKLEAKYALYLNECQKSGKLLFYLEQVPFKLPASLTYKLDFMEFWSDERIVLTEVKGMETKEWITRYKLFQETYPYLELNIIKKV